MRFSISKSGEPLPERAVSRSPSWDVLVQAGIHDASFLDAWLSALDSEWAEENSPVDEVQSGACEDIERRTIEARVCFRMRADTADDAERFAAQAVVERALSGCLARPRIQIDVHPAHGPFDDAAERLQAPLEEW